MRLRLSLLCVLSCACPNPTPRPDGGSTPPAITSISPTQGAMTGGTLVTVNGSRFSDGATVSFGSAMGSMVVVQNALRLTVRTPAVTNPGRVNVTVTNPDGTVATLENAFTFESVTSPMITQALLSNDAMAIDRTGMAMVSAPVRGQVEVPNVTRGMGKGAGVTAQVGYATMVSTPPAEADFTWTAAMHSGDVDGAMAGDLARDVFEGMVTLPGATTTAIVYRLAIRFSADNGMTWRLADRDGLANGIQEAQLAQFTVEPKGIEWCRMGGRTVGMAPPSVTLRGTQGGPLIYAQVFTPGRTEGAGAGAGVKGQIGYGPMGSAPNTWTWSDGAYNVDVGNNDEWQAVLPNPGTGTYRFAWRFNLDDGTHVYCDNDGLAMNGFTEDQSGTLTVGPPAVDSCVLQFPNSAQALVNAPGPTVYGRVFAGGVTDRDGGTPAITMELGIGPGGVTPDQSSWSWTPGTFNIPVAGGGAEFQAPLPASLQGTYAYAWRTRLAMEPYTYCDLDGSQNGFVPNQAGVYSVAPFSFTECRLQFPPTLTSAEGQPTGLVFGQVFATGGITTPLPDGGAPPQVEAQLGYGPANSDPSTPDAGWVFVPASFNIPLVGGGSEYQARLTGPAPGAYHYAYRVRYQSQPWTYCDRDGSSNQYQFAQAGVLTARPLEVDECTVETAVVQAARSLPLPTPFLARVRVPSITEGTGQGSGVVAEVGYGPVATTPSTWTTWAPATFTGDTMDFDRYSGTFTAPGTLATYDVAFRFRVGTRPHVYCDRDGLANGFSSTQAAQVVVSTAVITACQLGMPSAFSLASGSPLTATVSIDGTGTSAAGQASNLRAQIGMGPRDNASTSPLWGWGEASYSGDVSGRDVYGLTFQPSYTGLRAVSARVTADNGATWTYCDLNGSDQNGYEVSQQYDVSVDRHMSIDFCKLQFPATVALDAGTSRIYGQVFHAGLTPDAGAPIRAQFGIGARDREPGLNWTWGPAAFLGFGLPPTMNNNNEYAVDYAPDGSAPNYAFRFSRDDGGTWCYADLDGNGANGAGQGWDGFRGDLSGVPNLGTVTP